MKWITSLAAAALAVVAFAPSVLAEELMEIQLEAPAKAENAFAYYRLTAPDADYLTFLQDNLQLGKVDPGKTLDAGTIFYVPATPRKSNS